MKRAILLMQSINQHLVDTYISALPERTEAIVFTGTEIKVDAPHSIVKTPPHSPLSLVSRFKCWLAYAIAVRKWFKANKKKKVDLIFAVSNPPINSFLGVWLKKKFHAKFVYMEWDIYPQVIEETIGTVPVKCICRLWHMANNHVFPQIDKILTIGEKMKESICKPVKSPINVSVVPLYTDVERMKPVAKKENEFRRKLGLEDKFVVIYSGKMGIGHNIPLILDAAAMMENEYSDIVFLMIGFGPGYKLTDERVKCGAKNIVLLEPQPDDIFPFSMASGDVGIVSEEEKFAHLFLPSKSFDMMACGLPIVGITTVDDDLHNLIESNCVGKCVTDKQAETLKNAILYYYNNREELQRAGINARNAVVSQYTRSSISNLYKQIFESI